MGDLDPSFKCTLIELPCLAADRHIPPTPPAKIRCAENVLRLSGKRNFSLLFDHCFYADQISDVSRAPSAISPD